MALNRTQTNFRRRDDALGYITPKVILNDDVRSPKGPPGGWKPAPWLPVQFTKSTAIGGTDAFVCSSGKVVALDNQGYVVPAGFRTLLSQGAAALTYTADDVTWGVEDLVTGATVTAAVIYTTVQVAQALLERGFVRAVDFIAAGGTNPPTTNAHGAFATDLFISPPVGFAAYDYHVYSGRPEDGDMRFTNYSKQSAVAFNTEAQIEIPAIAAAAGTDSWAVDTINTAGTATAATGDQILPAQYWNATNIAALTKYSLLGITAASPVVALGMDPLGNGTQVSVAEHTDRTPFTCDTSGVLVRQRTSPELITREGDWCLDADLGTLFLHSDTWATGVAGTDTWVFSFDYYSTASSVAQKGAHFNGRALPGYRVTFDKHSNYALAVEGTTAERNIIGKVSSVHGEPRGLLSSVKTGFPGASSATAQMPGSATKGFSDKITFSGETVADQLVTLNVRFL